MKQNPDDLFYNRINSLEYLAEFKKYKKIFKKFNL